MSITPDRIEKRVVLRAPRERVWRAIADHQEFGAWFGVRLDGPFEAGARVTGVTVPTTVDPVVAEAQRPYEGTPWAVTVEEVDPPRRLAFRWHPYAVDPHAAYDEEPTTLVTFTLHDAPEGTELVIREEGFERIPLERRAEAFQRNDHGWTAQAQLVAAYLERTP